MPSFSIEHEVEGEEIECPGCDRAISTPGRDVAVEVQFEVWCSCGEGLCSTSETVERTGWWGTRRGVIVTPCPKCLARMSEEADEQAYQRGYDDGLAEGRKS